MKTVKVRDLTQVRINDTWLTVYMCGFDKERNEEYFTVNAEDGSYQDVFESQIQEKRYEDVEVDEDSLLGILSKVTYDRGQLR